MSQKHWNYKCDLVTESLRALCHADPELRFIESEKVVISATENSDKVTLISGGGSGHEPLHAGFVGSNLLDAAVAGHVFASPSVKQILSGIKAKPSNKGTLIICKNYTGDILHFGLAAERAKAEGLSVELLAVQDDVSVGRTKNGFVGRRGLAGTALVHKICGSKAGLEKASLKDVYQTGEAVNANLVTVGASLDHCSMPTRNTSEEDEEFEGMKEDEIEIGMGIHNEPGTKKVSPIPLIDDLVEELLAYLLSTEDKERHYVDFDKQDEVVLLINNLGGTSKLELTAIESIVYGKLAELYSIKPVRVYIGDFTTSLNMPGFSITLLNATKAGGKKILEYLDAPTTSLSWCSKVNTKQWESRDEILVEAPAFHEDDSKSDVKVDPKRFEAILRSGIECLLKKEPKITLYDQVAGDGDCGETLAGGANAIIKAIEDGKLDLSDGVKSFVQITDIVETEMGGTSGGLYSIFLSAIGKSLKHKEDKEGSYELSIDAMAPALHSAMESLFKYTRARAGGRTLIDALQPFVEELSKSKDLNKANKAANDGAEHTRKLEAKFGRASYVSSDEFKQFDKEGGLPDPGAIGLAALIDGFVKAYNG